MIKNEVKLGASGERREGSRSQSTQKSDKQKSPKATIIRVFLICQIVNKLTIALGYTGCILVKQPSVATHNCYRRMLIRSSSFCSSRRPTLSQMCYRKPVQMRSQINGWSSKLWDGAELKSSATKEEVTKSLKRQNPGL